MSTPDYAEMDRRIFEEVFNQSKLEVADELYSPTFVAHHPPQKDLLGPEGIKHQVRRTHAAYAEVHYTVEDHVCQGDKTLTRWSMTGTPRGELRGVRGSGGKVVLTGLTLLHYADDQVEEEWTYWDQLGLRQQLEARKDVEEGD
jgi:predicted ester cyclase